MLKDKDLSPWVMSGVLIVSGAVGAGIGLTGTDSRPAGLQRRTAPANPIGAPAAIESAPATSAAQAAPAADSRQAPVGVSSVQRPQLPPGQVFECSANGQRVFSDAPCGVHASVRQLGELNIMDSAPILRGPAYGPYDATYPPPPMDPYAPDSANDLYSGPQVIVLHERGRRDQFIHPEHHGHASPRKF